MGMSSDIGVCSKSIIDQQDLTYFTTQAFTVIADLHWCNCIATCDQSHLVSWPLIAL